MWADDLPGAKGLVQDRADGGRSFSYSLPHLRITGSITYTDERGKLTPRTLAALAGLTASGANSSLTKAGSRAPSTSPAAAAAPEDRPGQGLRGAHQASWRHLTADGAASMHHVSQRAGGDDPVLCEVTRRAPGRASEVIPGSLDQATGALALSATDDATS